MNGNTEQEAECRHESLWRKLHIGKIYKIAQKMFSKIAYRKIVETARKMFGKIAYRGICGNCTKNVWHAHPVPFRPLFHPFQISTPPFPDTLIILEIRPKFVPLWWIFPVLFYFCIMLSFLSYKHYTLFRKILHCFVVWWNYQPGMTTHSSR